MFVKSYCLYKRPFATILTALIAISISPATTTATPSGIEGSVAQIEWQRSVSDRRQPWRRTTESERFSAIYLTRDMLLVAGIRNAPAAEGELFVRESFHSSTLHGRLIAYESRLHLALVEILRPESVTNDARNPVLESRYPITPIELETRADPFAAKLKEQSDLTWLSLATDPRTLRRQRGVLFFTGYQSVSPADDGGHALPMLALSGFHPDLRRGDLIFSGDLLVGLLYTFDEKSRRGYALPIESIAQWLDQARGGTAAEARRPSRLSIRPMIARPGSVFSARISSPHSVLLHPGFRAEVIDSAAELAYYGIERPALLVSEVLYPWQRRGEPLRQGDLIMAIDGESPGRSGYFSHRIYGDLDYRARLALSDSRLRRPDESARLTILRSGQRSRIEWQPAIATDAATLLASHQSRAEWQIVGGLFFRELSVEDASDPQTPLRLRHLATSSPDRTTALRQRYLVLESILPLPTMAGYSIEEPQLLVSLNGILVRDIEHLRLLIDRARQSKEKLVFNIEGNRDLVFRPATLDTAERDLSERLGIEFLRNE